MRRRTLTTFAAHVAALASLFLGVAAHAAAPAVAKQADQPPGLTPEPIKDALWKNASRKAITSAEIDSLVAAELKAAGIAPAALTSDEQFLRRLSLDLAGKPPTPEQIRAFVEDKDSQKRAKLIDKLLDSDAFARNFARYWVDVTSARLVGNLQSRALQRPFEKWMTEQIKKNTSWADVTRDMLTATGEAKFDDSEGKSGKAYFLASHMGADAVVEQAAETARVFLGIQINCAQCHDHPFDVWKREQFHELAAYFTRVRARLMRDPESERVRFIGINLAASDRGGMGFGGGQGKGMGGNEYRMPDTNNPRNGKIVHPKPLQGKTPSRGLKDADRRKSLVDAMVDPNNYWFSAAYVNRIWGVLLGQSFYLPVDDMGPQREAVHATALTRLAGAFAGSNYDVKALFRVILNSETYQRESRVGKSRGEHLYFAASYPSRLRPGALYESLVNAVGPVGGGVGGGRGMMGGPGRGGPGGLDGMIRGEFGFDPSLKNDDVESSIPQALILMNNPQLNQKIRATGTTVLAKILSANSKDEPAVEAVYLQTLCRKPTSNELTKCVSHVKKARTRGEGFEDVMWALLNSTEFQTRR